MTKLKTLKDLERRDFYDLERKIIEIKELRDESMRWLKSNIDVKVKDWIKLFFNID